MSPSGVFMNGSTPTVLLVHGEFSDGSIWAGVIGELQAGGIAAVALANPLRGLASDAAYVAGALREIDGPVLLAGHSYGGAVITVAGSTAGNVAGLVYVAAFALDRGESIVDVTGRFPGGLLLPALRPAAFPGSDGQQDVELFIDREAFPQVFAGDLPPRIAAVAAAAQRPITAAAYEEKARTAAWRSAPSRYVIATADLVIPLAAQQFMAARAGAHTIEVCASHAVPLTHPEAVARQIAAAAGSHPR